jgi:hypothetical protein
VLAICATRSGCASSSQGLAVAPCEWRSVIEGGLFVALCFLECIWMLPHQIDPLDFLLEEAEGAAAPGPPTIIIGETEPSRFQEIQDALSVDVALW